MRLDDGSTISLRLMTEGDASQIVKFARALPEDDLLFLRTDITNPRAVDEWVDNLRGGRTQTIIAEAGGQFAGYASLHHNSVSWQRHLGEIRVQVGQRHRSKGLGRLLAGEVFQLARDLQLSRVVAQMTPDQKGAIATFQRLGFQLNALLQDYVIDRSNRTRDLLIMGYDMSGHTDHLD
ncbi:MAG: GNAT family N-acetyltransferase [Dehalococcoidia bacterium]